MHETGLSYDSQTYSCADAMLHSDSHASPPTCLLGWLGLMLTIVVAAVAMVVGLAQRVPEGDDQAPSLGSDDLHPMASGPQSDDRIAA
jgi:hypothetical protein